MRIRAFTLDDVERARDIHSRHYKEEFPFPKFTQFDSAFVIATDEDVPIIIGGVKPIAEIIIVTEKDFPTKVKREALYKTLEASSYMAHLGGFNQIHCAIQDLAYERHLRKLGFRPVKGTFLYLNVGDEDGKR